MLQADLAIPSFQAFIHGKLQRCLWFPTGDGIDIALSDDSDIEILEEAWPLSDGANDLSEDASADADDSWSGSESEPDAGASEQTGALSHAASGSQPGMAAAAQMVVAGPSAFCRPSQATTQQTTGDAGVAAPLAACLMGSENQAGLTCNSQGLQRQSAASQPLAEVPEPSAIEAWASHDGDASLDGFMDSGKHFRPR